MSKGIVYCLTNPEMQGLVKIGRVDAKTVDANGPEKALQQHIGHLYTTGVPVPFDLYHAVSVADPEKIESGLFDAFKNCRENPRREFFSVHEDSVVAAMNLTGGEHVVLSDLIDDSSQSEVNEVDIDAQKRSRDRENENKEKRERHPIFKFSHVGIEVGSEIVFAMDAALTAEVLEDAPNKAYSQIQFRGKICTLSGAAKEIMAERGHYKDYPGTDYWKYNGKTLNQLRADKAALESQSEE